MRGSVLLLMAVAAAAQPPKPGGIEGVVTNALTGEPVARAHVRLGADQKSYGAISTAEGKFSISAVTPGPYIVAVERAGFLKFRGAADVRPEMTVRSYKVELVPEGSISGRVLDPDGQPLEGVKVRAAKGRISESRYTNDRGEFRVDGLPPGKYKITAMPSRTVLPPEIRTDGTREDFFGDGEYSGVLELRAGGEVTGVAIRLERTGPVRVSGVLAGAAGGQVRVEAERVGDPDFTGPGIVKGAAWEIWNLMPGRYRIGARVGTLASATEEIEVGATDIEGLEIRLMAPFELTGRIESDEPMQALIPMFPRSQRRAMALLRVRPDGSFQATDVRPERYVIGAPGAFAKAVYLGQTEMRDGVLDLSRGPGGPVVIRLAAPTGSLSGTVREAKGSVTVTLERVSRPEWRKEVETTGRFAFEKLAPGTYRLSVADEEPETIELGDGERVVRDLKPPR